MFRSTRSNLILTRLFVLATLAAPALVAQPAPPEAGAAPVAPAPDDETPPAEPPAPPGAPPAAEAAAPAAPPPAAAALAPSPMATPTVAAAPAAAVPAPPATPDPAVEPEEAPLVSGYDKGFFVQTADEHYRLKVNIMLQPRLTWEGVDHGQDEMQLAVKRARLQLTGNAFSSDLSYFFQLEGGSGAVSLIDAFLDYGIVPGKLHVRLGQFRKPYGRQFISAVTKLELVDRSMIVKAFGDGRDLGFTLHNQYEKSPRFEYAVGAFNGNGSDSRLSGDVLVDPETGEGEITSGKFSNIPDHFHPLVVARVGYNHGEMSGYSEGDLEGGAPRLAVGLAGMMDFDADGGDDSMVEATVDAMFKAYGFSSTGAVFVASGQTGSDFEDRAPADYGFFVQGGYLIAERFQPVARWAVVFPDGDLNDYEEILGGLSIYFQKHSLKWQTESGISSAETTRGSEISPVVRSQLQAVF